MTTKKNSKSNEMSMIIQAEKTLIAALTVLAHHRLDELSLCALNGDQTDDLTEQLKDVIDGIHDAKQRILEI